MIQESDLRSLVAEQRIHEREKSKPRKRAVGPAGWSRNSEELKGRRNHLRVYSEALGALGII